MAKQWIDCEHSTYLSNGRHVNLYSDCVSLVQSKGNVVIQRSIQQGPLLLRGKNTRASLGGHGWSNQVYDAFIGRYIPDRQPSQNDEEIINTMIFKSHDPSKPLTDTPTSAFSSEIDQIETNLGKEASFPAPIEFQPFLVKVNN